MRNQTQLLTNGANAVETYIKCNKFDARGPAHIVTVLLVLAIRNANEDQQQHECYAQKHYNYNLESMRQGWKGINYKIGTIRGSRSKFFCV